MNRVLLILGGLLVGLLSALFLVPVFVDWTRYRGAFEEEATRLLGRDVRVGGRVNMRLLPTPYVRFERVRVSDTRATVGEPLFRAEEFTIWLSASALLAGNIQASAVELKKPVVTLVVEPDGSGNWATLADRGSAAQSSFIPAAVALDQVRITNGTLAVFDASGDERTRFEHINGELSAAALEGPYRINVAYAQSGQPRELRLSTARTEADGSVRFKGAIRAAQSGANFTVDGTATDIFRKIQLKGDLTAKLPVAALSGAPAPAVAKRPDAQDAYDLKATVAADTNGAAVRDISLSFEQDGQPQLAVGSGYLAWTGKAASTLDLSSKWVDLDRIGARTETTTVSDLAKRLLKSLDSAVPSRSNAQVRIQLEQATFGGDIVSRLDLALERSTGPLAVRTSASLPGGARLESAGSVSTANPNSWFEGEMRLRGANLGRFSNWAMRGTRLAALKDDGPFTVQGKVAIGDERIAGRGLVVRIGGNNLTGDVIYGWSGGSRQVALSLDGSDLDATPFLDAKGVWPGALGAFAASFAGNETAKDDQTSVEARLRIGRLTVGATTLKDVVTDVVFGGGRLSIPMLRIGTPETHLLELRGDVGGFLRKDRRGSLAYLASAQTRADLDELASLLGGADFLKLAGDRTRAALPARLAGRIRLGETAADKIDITLDGNLDRTRASGVVRWQVRGETWLNHPIDAVLTLQGDNLGSVLHVVAPGIVQAPGGGAQRAPAQVSIRSLGSARTGLASLAAVDSAAINGEWRGVIKLAEAADIAIDGTARATVADLAALLAELGVKERHPLAGVKLAGSGQLVGSLRNLAFNGLQIALDDARITGRVEIDNQQPRTRVSGDLKSDRITLAALLAGITAARAQVPPSARVRWSEDPLDLALLAGFDGRIAIETGELALAQGVTLRDVKGSLALDNGAATLAVAEAGALGGKLTGSLKLARAPAGVRMTADARIVGARLEAGRGAAAGGKHPATGGLALTIGLEGAGLSQRSIAAGLRGTGELKLSRVELDRLSPKAVAAAAERFVALPAETPRSELQRLIAAALATGPVSLGDKTVAIEVADGVARLAPLGNESADGRITSTTTIDMEAMAFDSEWRVEMAPGTGGSGSAVRLPAVVVVYTGAVTEMAAAEPRVSVEALERELTVRRMERDLAELERLRKLDEERARAEAERSRLLEEERQRQQLPPLQDPPPGPQPAPQQKGAGGANPAAVPPPTNIAVPLPIAPPVETPGPAAAPGQPAVSPAPEPHARPAAANPNAAQPSGQPPLEANPARQPARPPAPAPRRDIFHEIGRSSGG